MTHYEIHCNPFLFQMYISIYIMHVVLHYFPILLPVQSRLLYCQIMVYKYTRPTSTSSQTRYTVAEMDHDHDKMDMSPPPPAHHMNTMMMHMTFYWGKQAEVLFSGWPGDRSGMYAVALIGVFVMGVVVEWVSYGRLIKPGPTHVAAGVAQTVLYAIRIGLAYMMMLALMSFNGGVFLMAVTGHAVGFLVFGSRVFRGSESVSLEKTCII